MLSLSQLRAPIPAGTYASIDEEEGLNEVPIEPSWILDGTPVSRVKRLHTSSDSLYEVAIWECNAGRFRWYFGCDEVVHIIAGEVTVREDDGSERTLRAGDTAMFPRGSTNIWYVQNYVRKIATLRYHPPGPLDLVKQMVRRGRSELKKLYESVRPPATTAAKDGLDTAEPRQRAPRQEREASGAHPL